MENHDYEYIEVLPYLQSHYPGELNPNISSVQFCQTEDEVFVRIIRSNKTPIGERVSAEIINLDFVCDPYDTPLDIVPEGLSKYEELAFKPDSDIVENATNFLSDKVTLMNTTPLFDK